MGLVEFDAYYLASYGLRWIALRQALLEPSVSFPFYTNSGTAYYMDQSSVIAARSLRMPQEGLILDACAAPGGKTLVLASSMPHKVCLLANELSADRRRRLVDTLNEHLEGELRSRVTVSGFDAAAQGGRKSEQNRYGAILLDAPCSSERHVLSDPKALEKWTPARPRFLAQRQWALLSAAFRLLIPGGSLVYATCALSEQENDGVAARLFKKYGSRVEADPLDFTQGEASIHGRIILPDRAEGAGPMYVARFRKSVD